MSYCRFIEADAYIYDNIYHGLLCCMCSLSPARQVYNDRLNMMISVTDDFIAGYDYDLMLAHVAEHRANGDYIPEDVDERLRFERDCNHDFNSEGICKHCWAKNDIME